MKFILLDRAIFFLVFCTFSAIAQDEVYPGADEKSPSRAQYFSWINNTNEGSNEEHTRINLEFFNWLKREYGMQLDIYAFDAGAIDGKLFYGSIYSDRFRNQFPNGFDPIYNQAKSMGIRLGIWGGPDGFGDSREEEQARINQMVKLCRDYEFELFKFDAVCGPLRPEKEDAFIEMMQECRKYSPDLILLNHRLGLDKSKPYATTFLWGGAETYIDVHMTNTMTAPHNRAQALHRGLVPGLLRLTEDHGVCISSCLDYWDDEFPKLARIYNLHRKYRDILVNGKELPDTYGQFAVSRGDKQTRMITLRNLGWDAESYTVQLDEEIGLETEGNITLLQLHPTEKIVGMFKKGDMVEIDVMPFSACMLLATTLDYNEPAISGADYSTERSGDVSVLTLERFNILMSW